VIEFDSFCKCVADILYVTAIFMNVIPPDDI
jgi:hypothetical protein